MVFHVLDHNSLYCPSRLNLVAVTFSGLFWPPLPPQVREQAPLPSPPSLPPSPPSLPEVSQQPGQPQKKPDQKWWDKILGAFRPGDK